MGVKESSTEKVVGNKHGIFVVQSIRRKPEPDRFVKEILMSLKGVPWNPNSDENPSNTLDFPLTVEVENPEIPRGSIEAYERPVQSRRHYVLKGDLIKYGFSEGCKACDEIRKGRSKTGGVAHTSECRQRIELCSAEDPTAQERLERSQQREIERLARALEDGQKTATEAPSSGAAKQTKREERGSVERKTIEPEATERSSSSSPTPAEKTTTSSSTSKKARFSAPEPMPGGEGGGGAAFGSPRTLGSPSGGSEGAEMEVDNNRGTKRSGESAAGVEDEDRMIDLIVESSREKYLCDLKQLEPQEPVCEEPSFENDLFDQFSYEFVDDVSGNKLDPEGVKVARKSEMEFIQKMGVWEVVPRPKCKVIGTRWVDTNKGDQQNPNYRSRLVAQEVKKGSVAEYFAAMPPLSALKMLLTLATTDRIPDADGKKQTKDEPWLISFVDVKRAHFCADATRELYVELPPESGHSSEYVGRLKKSMYGCRDAGMNWELTIAKVMTRLGFIQGKSSPCLYHHPSKNLKCVVHGDDFTTLGPRSGLDWLHKELEKEWMITVRGILGPPSVPNCLRSITILRRIVTWDENGISWEADQRHSDILLQELGVTGMNIKTPAARDRQPASDDEDPLPAEQIFKYRSLAMRASYLSQDRPDLQYACRELAKGMSKPTNGNWKSLKRIARYLKYRPRVVQRFRGQESLSELTVWCDADHAGCIRTRKSTSGGVLMLGNSVIKTYSRGQGVISLSSGEAEYYALVSAASEGLGETSNLLDWGVKVQLVVNMDATAGISLGSRRGLGRAKHIDTCFLWVQNLVSDGKIRLRKKHTSEMLADMLTKPVPESSMLRFLGEMGYEFADGKHALALEV